MHVLQSDDKGVPENELPPKPEQTGEKQTESASAGAVQSDDAAASGSVSSKPEQKEEEQTGSESADVPTFLVTFVRIRVIAADVSALGDKQKMTQPSIYCKVLYL